MKMKRISFSAYLILLFGLLVNTATAQSGQQDDGSQTKMETKSATIEKLTFESKDGLAITADLYMAHQSKDTPFIVLCHQAGWSRGEYREIAPKLNELGFNCLAIDQRSGDKVNDVMNETAKAAKAASKGVQYVDAEQDMVAAIEFAKQNYAKKKLVLWGSSYSSALAIRIAGEHPDKIDAALAFSPGEYFGRQGKPSDWIQQSAKKIKDPVFITSAKNESNKWSSIANAIPTESLKKFVPKTKGNHGSRALWKKFNDNGAYWTAVKTFLEEVK